MMSLSSASPPPAAGVPSYNLDVHLSYGQSWRSNAWPDFASFGLAQKAVVALHYTNSVVRTVQGTLPQNAGISLPGTVDGLTEYTPSDMLTIGRCAIIAHQLLRIADGVTTLPPTTEACFAYPASAWNVGLGGGLSYGATFNGAVATDVLTAQAPTVGLIVAHQHLAAPGIDAGTTILSGPAAGGAGAYTTAIVQFFVATTLHMTNSVVVGNVGDGGVSPGNILNVASVTSGTVTIGDAVPLPARAGTTIISQRDGTPGGVGNYIVRVGAAQNVASEAMTTTTTSWTNQGLVIGQMRAMMPQGRAAGLRFTSLGYTQGGSAPVGTNAAKVQDLTEMLTAYDAMGLPR